MRAISPVIATVIIVSVAIAISIAVALWLAGITTGFTGMEKLEIVSAYAEKWDTGNGWTITMTVKNTGTSTATLTEIFINKKPAWKAGSITGVSITVDSDTIDPGQTITITIEINKTAGAPYISGQTLDITLHTAAGRDYPKAVTLP